MFWIPFIYPGILSLVDPWQMNPVARRPRRLNAQWPSHRRIMISFKNWNSRQTQNRERHPQTTKAGRWSSADFVESLATRGIEWMDLDPALRHLLKTDPEARKDFQQVQLTPDQARAYDPSKKGICHHWPQQETIFFGSRWHHQQDPCFRNPDCYLEASHKTFPDLLVFRLCPFPSLLRTRRSWS